MQSGRTVGIVVGNPRPHSRTSQVARRVGDRLAGLIHGTVGPVVDLSAHGTAVLDANSEHVRNDVEALVGVDVLVVASPTYKATYTGLLKAFLDRFGAGALSGIHAVPVMVAATPRHTLAVEVHLRPLLVEMGAFVSSPGLSVLDAELDQLDPILTQWLDVAGPPLQMVTRASVNSVG